MKRNDIALPLFNRTTPRARGSEAGLRAALALFCMLATGSARAGDADPAAPVLPETTTPLAPAPPDTAAPTASAPPETTARRAPALPETTARRAPALPETTAPAAPSSRATATAMPAQSGAVASVRARAACPNCCRVSVDMAARLGLSINGDQWLSGGQLRTSLPCLGNLGFGPMLALGVGGNHVTVRSAGRLDYMLWLDDAHVFGIYPAVGASVLFYVPVGQFAEFCHRVGLDECSGYIFGGEVGGGLRYRRFALDAFLGFGGLPVLSIMAAMSFPLAGAEGP